VGRVTPTLRQFLFFFYSMSLEDFIKACAILGEGIVLSHHYIWRRRG
jgi:hypothetical protein